jgi:hypothetical protein
MNDYDFLLRFREAPSPDFARELYEKISQSRGILDARFVSRGDRFLLRRVRLGFLVLCIVIAGLLLASPVVRAQVGQLLSRFIKIAGINFVIKDFDKSPGGTPVTDVYRTTLDGAVQMLPDQLMVPTWVPEGFSLSGVELDLPKEDLEMEMAPFKASIVLTWKRESDQGQVFLEVIYPKEDDFSGAWLVNPEGQLEEVVVKDQPGVLLREASWWNFETGEWVESPGLRLFVKLGENNVLYKFSCPEGTTSAEDLLAMAESLRAYR